MKRIVYVSTMSLLAAFLSIASLIQPIFADALTSPLMIASLVPDTNNVAGSDAYEYIELVNVSDQTLSTQDYRIVYDNGSNSVNYTLQEDLPIDKGKTLVIWVTNEANKDMTVSDFNAEMNTDLIEGVNVARTEIVSGLANSGERKIYLEDRLGNRYGTYIYNEGGVKSVLLNKEIQFTIESNDVTRTRYDGDLNPGIIEPSLIPSETMRFEPSHIEHIEDTVPSTFFLDKDFEVSLTAQSTNKLARVTLNYMLEGDTEYRKQDITSSEGRLSTTLKLSQLMGSAYFDSYFELSDGVSVIETDVKRTVLQDASTEYLYPELMITELAPDTNNRNGSDAFEFIEVYNNSDREINFKDYTLMYLYPETGKEIAWPSDVREIEIPSQSTVVFWIKNAGNGDLSADAFNQEFGTSLVADETLHTIHSDGMANSGVRGMRIATNTGISIHEVVYNENGGDDTFPTGSIGYRYDPMTQRTEILNNNKPATPGTLETEYQPLSVTQSDAEGESFGLDDLSDSEFNGDSDLTFKVAVSNAQHRIKTVTLYVKDNRQTQFTSYNLRGNAETFTYTIDSIDLIGKQHFEYYFEVSDGFNEAVTDLTMVKSTKSTENTLDVNVKDQEVLSQVHDVIVSNATQPVMSIDGKDVNIEPVPSLSSEAMIVFDVSETDTFFKNAVAIGDDVLGVFHEGTYNTWRTYSYPVPVKYFTQEAAITLDIHAGNKANVLEHNEENNDDFIIKNIRLLMPDGETLRPKGYDNPSTVIKMGDSAGKVEILNATFDINKDSFDSFRYSLNTKDYEDGSHRLSVIDGESFIERTLLFDNTAPQLTTNMEDGKIYKGTHTITAQAEDAISGVQDFVITLDGKGIDLPYDVSSSTLNPGNHELILTAIDNAQNEARKIVVFEIPVENPDETTGMMATAREDGIELSALVSDPTQDRLDVTFKRGYQYKDDEVNEERRVSMVSGDIGERVEYFDEVMNGFPTLLYTLDDHSELVENGQIRIQWEGSVSKDESIILYVYNPTTTAFDKIKRKISDSNTITFDERIDANTYIENGQLKYMIQAGEGYNGIQNPLGAPVETGQNTSISYEPSADETPRESYDYTFGWVSDTQYYNEDKTTGKYEHQVNIVDWVKAHRNRLNLQYVFHTGDIVDDMEQDQWNNADSAYKVWDEANIPYGVLAGNHDVGHLQEDYSQYSEYFGEARYAQKPWYQESYKDNRGHYDLITVGGVDYIMVYMGWGVYEEQITWINDVLEQYPNRKAILNFHEYLLQSGGLGEQPQAIYDRVVSQNSNVVMVLSGHYHNAFTRIDAFDDDGDGVKERKVYQMLFDYQGLEEGGLGYLRLMHFDNQSESIRVRTYSPSLDDYDAGVSSIIGEEDFVIPYEDLGIKPRAKQLEATQVKVQLYGNEIIGEVLDVASDTVVSTLWKDAPYGELGWYVKLEDSFGGVSYSDVVTFTHTEIEGSKETYAFKEKEVRLNVNETHQIEVIKTETRAQVGDDRQWQWSSSHPEIASVDSNGLVTAHTVGKTIVNLTVGENQISIPVIVSDSAATQNPDDKPEIGGKTNADTSSKENLPSTGQSSQIEIFVSMISVGLVLIIVSKKKDLDNM